MALMPLAVPAARHVRGLGHVSLPPGWMHQGKLARFIHPAMRPAAVLNVPVPAARVVSRSMSESLPRASTAAAWCLIGFLGGRSVGLQHDDLLVQHLHAPARPRDGQRDVMRGRRLGPPGRAELPTDAAQDRLHRLGVGRRLEAVLAVDVADAGGAPSDR